MPISHHWSARDQTWLLLSQLPANVPKTQQMTVKVSGLLWPRSQLLTRPNTGYCLASARFYLTFGFPNKSIFLKKNFFFPKSPCCGVQLKPKSAAHRSGPSECASAEAPDDMLGTWPAVEATAKIQGSRLQVLAWPSPSCCSYWQSEQVNRSHLSWSVSSCG